MGKLKVPTELNQINSMAVISGKKCKQWEDDVLLEFGSITSKKRYSFEALKHEKKNNSKAIEEFMDLILIISESNWKDLGSRGKRTKGGFELLNYSDLNSKIIDNYWKNTNKSFAKDRKIHVFRFGCADKYRMIGYKSHNCNRVLHILGFDLDFSLYDHGRH